MITIGHLNSERFKLNGVPYHKNFMSQVSGNNIRIINSYDSLFVLVDWTDYQEFSVLGNTFNNANELHSNLLAILYVRSSLGVGIIDVSSYQNYDDLPGASSIDENTPAKVVNDVDSSLNGYYSVSSGAWVKDAGFYENKVDVNNTSIGVSGKAVVSYRERFNCFEEYKAIENIGYSDKLHNGSSTFFNLTVKDFYNAFSYLRLYGFDSTRPQKLWFLCRNNSSSKYRFIIREWDGSEWINIFDSGTGFTLVESTGITHVEKTVGAKRVEFGIDYSIIPDGIIAKPNHYRNGGGFDSDLNETEFVVKKEFVFDELNPTGGEQYDQQLNTTDDVSFNSIATTEISVNVLVANLPEGSGSEPNGLLSGQAWIDTSNGRVIKQKA